MTPRLKFWLPMAAATLILLAGRTAPAQETPATAPAPAKSTAWSNIFDLLGSNSLPSLAGLIRPEKMGVLTDNPNRKQKPEKAPKRKTDRRSQQ